jgi:hypothetical protein
MAYDGWIRFNGVELVNISRTAQLAESMGIDVVWVAPTDVEWIQDALGESGVDYEDVATAPWYDAGFPASGEFAGIIPLAFAGLGDSTLSSTPIEYITDGGHSGKPRNTTLPIVANVAIVASTDRGAEFGKRWLDRMLKGSTANVFCSGADLEYFNYAGAPDADAPPVSHYRDVRLTRGTSVTRRRRHSCASTWLATFTMTAADPFEYGEPVPMVTELSLFAATGPKVTDSGSAALTQMLCPSYNYNPIFDPLYPALVASPTVPNFYPDGWDIVPGATFQRVWVRLSPVEPSSLNLVPVVVLTTDADVRMVRVSLWPADANEAEQCDPIWSAVVTYLPGEQEFTIDGEQKVSYVWNGTSPGVNRADSLVYGPDAEPIEWTAFNDPDGLLFALDLMDGDGSDGVTSADLGSDGVLADVKVSLALVPKSD